MSQHQSDRTQPRRTQRRLVWLLGIVASHILASYCAWFAMRTYEDFGFDLSRAPYAPLWYPVYMFFYWVTFFLGFIHEFSDSPRLLEVLLFCWAYFVPLGLFVLVLALWLTRRSRKEDLGSGLD